MPGTIKPGKRRPAPAAAPTAGRPKIGDVLRSQLRAMAQADARMIREIEAMTGGKVRMPKASVARKPAGPAKPSTGRVSDALRANLRQLAQSDARMMRGMAQIARDATPKIAGGKSSRRLRGR